MRDKLLPMMGAIAAAGLMILLFKPDAATSDLEAASERSSFGELRMAGLDGTPWNLADHRGKVVLVNFWATWCPPCRAETPGLVRIANDFAGKVAVAGISLDEGTDEVHRFVADYKVPYPVLIPPADDAISAGVQSLPTTLLIDRQGRVAKTYRGAESERVFRHDIEHLLSEP
ncbi:MAG TPA: TlpA disulfide reductase family protein [Bryobacteraceae bacterium]|nr:TlpA disulfide reductase family protein [Bryobacteraceae bacterium]